MERLKLKLDNIADAIREKTGGTELLTLDDMAVEIAGISNGAELNFEVVSGIIKPENPTENTIWVNTDTEISDWIFSLTEPTELVEGMVWFPIGSSSPVAFNALKKNNIYICPMVAKQYINSEWTDKIAKTFINSNWADWTHYLYNHGEMVPFSKWTAAQGLVENKADHVLLSKSGNATPYLGWWTEDSVDLSGYKKLCAEVACTVELIANDFAAWKFKFGVFSAKLIGNLYVNSSSNMIAGTGFTGDTVKRVYEVDITDLTGGYVGIQGTGVAEVYKIWLE